jgi:integrase
VVDHRLDRQEEPAAQGRRRTALFELLDDYLDRFVEAIGRPLKPSGPVVCRQKPGGGVGHLSWGRPLRYPSGIQKILAIRAAQAGLGHMSPHDLRRTAAGILHRAVSDDGAHYFDLLDIQKVLGHANPATTMRFLSASRSQASRYS